MIHSSPRGIFRKADRRRGVSLRIAINQKCGVFNCSKASGKIHGGGSLPDSTFLICNRNDPGQALPPNHETIAEAIHARKLFHVKLWMGCGFSVESALFHVEHRILALSAETTCVHGCKESDPAICSARNTV